MEIKINYTLYTDGDYCLMNAESFGCTGREVEIDDEYFDYVGSVEFKDADKWKCKHEAKNFLKRFLCDGIHVSYTHYWLINSFYNIIDELIKFIDHYDSGGLITEIGGNQDGTYITVIIKE